jgi:hypothetical protein
MALFAMAVPVPSGKLATWEKFIEELNGAKRAEYVANRKSLGVRERTFHQQTPMGDLVIVTLEGDDPEAAFARFAQGDDAFTRWFLKQVKDIHGIDLAAPPPGPPPRLVVDSG